MLTWLTGWAGVARAARARSRRGRNPPGPLPRPPPRPRPWRVWCPGGCSRRPPHRLGQNFFLCPTAPHSKHKGLPPLLSGQNCLVAGWRSADRGTPGTPSWGQKPTVCPTAPHLAHKYFRQGWNVPGVSSSPHVVHWPQTAGRGTPSTPCSGQKFTVCPTAPHSSHKYFLQGWNVLGGSSIPHVVHRLQVAGTWWG